MKTRIVHLILCIVALTSFSSPAWAKLFIVEIEGQKVVVQYFDEEEQSWQNTQEGEPGWWDGVAPHPFESKIWYPYLSDTFDMTLDQQIGWIERLNYAGISDWRIGQFWDTVPLKASIFGGLALGGVNLAPGIDSSVYFPPTACGTEGAVPGGIFSCVWLGRTGNEDGALTGAIINPWEFIPGVPFPPAPAPNPRYVEEGVIVREGFGFGSPLPVYYTLPLSEAQDHWFFVPEGSPGPFAGANIYNDDLNFNRDDTTIGEMSPLDPMTGERPIGAWTVSDAMPQLLPWPFGKRGFRTISISDVVHVSTDNGVIGALRAVGNVEVTQDEPSSYWGDARVRQAAEATYVELRPRARWKGNGRVYRISFTDQSGDEYELKIGVPRRRGHPPIDDGGNYASIE